MVNIRIRTRERKKKTVIYFDIHYDGKRWYERQDIYLTGDKKGDSLIMQEAERLRAERLIQLSSGYDVTMRNIDFLKYYEAVKNETPEYERRAGVYKNLVKYCQINNIKRLNFKDITPNFWAKFKEFLIVKEEHSPHTIYTEYSVLKAVLNKAIRENLVLVNPLRGVKERKPKTTRKFLTYEELQKLKNTPCIDENVKRAFLFACGTGLRLIDIEHLKKENVEDEINIIMVKTGAPLNLPYSADLLQYIPGFNEKQPGEKLFKLPARSTMGTILKAWVERAEIGKKITFHSSRHTYATLHLTYGTRIEVLRDLLGHKDVRETQIYAKILDEKKKEAVNNLPPI
jgi:integrase